MTTETKKEAAIIAPPKTIKVSATTHEQLRVIAFKKNIKIKAVIELLLKEYAIYNQKK